MPADTVTLGAWNFKEIADKRPADYIYALMSNHVYGDIKKDDTLQPEKNWVVKRVSADKSGYFGAIYINNKENHIVVAHRGTDSIRAVIEDIRGIVLNNISPQKEAAFELVREAIILAKKKNYSLSFTGHSLGAFLAELSVFYCKRDGFDKVNAVTFESPGSKESLEKLQPNLEPHTIDLSNLDIVAYVTYPNLINTYNRHVGTMYTITPDLGKFGYIPGRYTQQAHIMAGILKCLNNKQSFDERKFLTDWPVNGLSKEQVSQFFEVAKWDSGSYLLPADEKLSTHQCFKLLYKAHYNSVPELSTHNILPIKHFSEDMQKFLVIFKSWREKNKDSAKQKLEEIIRDSDIVNYLLNYQLITHKRNTFLVCDTEVAVFRRELSKFLEEKGSQIKELINSLPSANLEIIAAILAPDAQLLAGGVIEHSKVAGLNITIPEGTSQEDIDAINQILEKAKEGVGKISTYIVAPGASCAGSIIHAASYGVSVELTQRATPPAITPRYLKDTLMPRTQDTVNPASDLDYDWFDVGDNGDCLFKSIAHQLNTRNLEKTDHIKVRIAIADYIDEHWGEYIEYITEQDLERAKLGKNKNAANLTKTEKTQYITALKQYAQNEQYGYWGDHISIKAAAQVYNVNIYIRSRMGRNHDIKEPETSADNARDTIYIGHIAEFHYQSLAHKSNEKNEKNERIPNPSFDNSKSSTYASNIGLSLSSMVHQEEFSEEQIREIESRKTSGESPRPLA